MIAFTKILNDATASDHIPGCRVVAGFPGGSPDVQASASRVEGFTKQLRETWKIEIVPDIPTLLERVDVVMIESVDGRPHLEQVRPVFAAKKRVFIDKPLAGSLEDAREIVRLSKETGTPFFSASAYRFVPAIRELRDDPAVGKVVGCDAVSPCSYEPHHPDLYWYGIHGVEALYTIMGKGCVSVVRVATPGTDFVVGQWADGRIGTFRGIRAGRRPSGVIVYGDKGTRESGSMGSVYKGLMEAAVAFFQTGVAPIDPEETLEVFEFMTAAQKSKERGGAPVSLDELRKAK
ncbi:MAG: Gfo/Idh/MocA family oxidoreductase [Planctomycetes bacterium]|nr:Gfo/Idh/MocA family oxidoreductase [Planctomycetota bacterium]